MLQKWVFRTVLLYNSLGKPNVLKKILNFDKYREYEYLKFKRVYLIDMFFKGNFAADGVTQRHKQTLLYQGLAALIAYHFVLLLVPTYIWLRKQLLR